MKQTLAIIAAGAIVAASVGAYGLNAVLSRTVLAIPEGEAIEDVRPLAAATAGEARSEARPSRGRPKNQYLDAILRRNLFDSSAVNKGVTTGAGDTPIVTDLNVRLIATLVAQPENFSSALIAEDEEDALAQGYGIGDRIQDAEITAIEPKRVTVKRANGETEYLLADGEAPRSSGSSSGNDSGGEEIQKVGDNKYAVSRELVDKSLGDLESLSRSARAIMHRDADGNVDGYRLSAVRRNSLLHKLGIRNGDIVHGVNGQSLDSLQSAMGAFESLQNESSFSFDISRRGSKQSMEYEIR